MGRRMLTILLEMNDGSKKDDDNGDKMRWKGWGMGDAFGICASICGMSL